MEDRENKAVLDAAASSKTGRFDFKELKARGIIPQRQRDKCTVRLKCSGGRVPIERLAKIVEVARRYAGTYVHISVRQSVELPYVDSEDVERVRRELAEVGQEIASAGARVRVPTACAGCEYNPKGLTDTQKMAAEVCERFFGKQPLPHKFKIVFSGCPNDCVRSSSSDLGFQGAVKPKWDQSSCIGCRLCATACTEGAIESDPDSGQPIYHPEKCLFCGDCIRACPTESWKAETTGWIVRCGGKHGRHPINGQVVGRFVSDERIPLIVEAVLSWYEKNGRDKGRVRLGTLLLDEKLWTDFLEAIRPALGVYAVPNSSPPLRNEIHFAAR